MAQEEEFMDLITNTLTYYKANKKGGDDSNYRLMQCPLKPGQLFP